MTDPPSRTPGPPEPEGGVAEALRTAVERTMQATAGSAATTRERAAELVDDVVQRGREARDQLARRSQEAGIELARRGQEAGIGLARRGQEATGEVARRVEMLERRLAELEQRLDATAAAEPPRKASDQAKPRPQAED